MFTSLNPGITAEVSASSAFGLAIFVLLGAAFVTIIPGAIFGTRYDNNPTRLLKVLSTVCGAIIGLFSVGAVLAMCFFVGTWNNERVEYRADVRAWLSSEYSIDVTADETETLVGRDEFGVEIDGEIIAIQLVDGAGDLLQVREVGGHVIDPASTKHDSK